MSESSSADKSEQPTEQKLRKAREQGQVARSRDLATAVGLIVTIQITAALMPWHLERFRRLFLLGFADIAGAGTLDNVWSTVWSEACWLLLTMIAPLFITPILVAVSSLMPGGWVLSISNLEPKFSRMNPLSNLGKLFTLKHYSDLFMSVLKVVAIASVVYIATSSQIDRYIGLQSMSLDRAIAEGTSLFLEGLMLVVGIFVILAIIDVPLQRFFFMKGQRMSKSELKEEHKSTEGRPEVRQRIRQLQRQMSRRSLRSAVPKADTVIVNPEHYAVAIRYDPKRAEAPFVLAKGVDEMALYIRELARKHNIEVVLLPPLARAIYNTSQVNQQIPSALYGAVAQVLHYVMQIKAFRDGGADRAPTLPSDIEIPKSLSESKQ